MPLRVFHPSAPPLPQPRIPSGRTVGDVLDWHVANNQDMTSAVARAERDRLFGLFRAFVTSDGRVLGDTDVVDCMGADLVEFINAHCGNQWTRRRYCGTIKRPFNLATELGRIGRNPFASVRERKGKRGRDITWDEFRAILRDSPPSLRRVLIFCRFSGCRPEELRTLEWPHVNWQTREVTKEKHKTAHKTDKPRVIQLNTQCLRMLLWLHRHQKHNGKSNVFLNCYGRAWSCSALCKAVREHRRKLKLPEDCKLYGCRHAFITEAVLSGIDIALVAELVGHESIVTTQTYLHLAKRTKHLAAAMERAVKFGGEIAPDIPKEKIAALVAELLKLLGK